jgi:predicted metal-dependent phosphoesterase TrpH
VRQIVGRLASLGIPLDADAILQPAIEDPARSAGRPWIARALVAAGYARSSDEAFERWLVRGAPAYIVRQGPTPEDAFARIHEAGGLASLAHPGLVRRDEWIAAFASQGLDALEAYHSEHDEAATECYLARAAELGLAVSGGSDFHGDPTHGPSQPGAVALPREEYERLSRRAQIARLSAPGSGLQL